MLRTSPTELCATVLLLQKQKQKQEQEQKQEQFHQQRQWLQFELQQRQDQELMQGGPLPAVPTMRGWQPSKPVAEVGSLR